MRMQHKRRGLQKTDYKKRLALIKSNKPRLVVRRRLDNMSVQVVNFKNSGDATAASAFSAELAKLGWKGGNGNIPAAYLTGLLAGTRAVQAGIKEAVLDIGLQTNTKGSRIYAALKGAVDAGLSVPHSGEILPSEDRISGKHIQSRKNIDKEFAEVKEKILKR
jgi:large subunit ribosomal protein L18